MPKGVFPCRKLQFFVPLSTAASRVKHCQYPCILGLANRSAEGENFRRAGGQAGGGTNCGKFTDGQIGNNEKGRSMHQRKCTTIETGAWRPDSGFLLCQTESIDIIESFSRLLQRRWRNLVRLYWKHFAVHFSSCLACKSYYKRALLFQRAMTALPHFHEAKDDGFL